MYSDLYEEATVGRRPRPDFLSWAWFSRASSSFSRICIILWSSPAPSPFLITKQQQAVFVNFQWHFPLCVHLGKDLCKTHHQSLMGRNYASHKTLIIYDWYTLSREGFMQNAKRVGTLPLACNWLWISVQLSRSLQQVSPL